MSMAGICRAFRKALPTQVSALKPHIALHGIIPAVFPCIHHSLDSTAGLQNCFVDKHAPYLLQLTQLGYSSVGNSNNSIPHRQHLPVVNPPPQAFLHLEAVKKKLRGIPHACISYQQLLELCVDSCEDEGKDIIKSLEQAGSILRIGQTVYLHPEQIARDVENVLPLFVDDSSIEELKILETEKAAIDVDSERQMRKELWCGLGFFSLQIVALLRLTFWEFSWEIMEPVSFYLTSAYFILGYAFFLKTKRDPTYRSFHAARFRIKQRKLMKMRNFNLQRYTELQGICRVKGNPI